MDPNITSTENAESNLNNNEAQSNQQILAATQESETLENESDSLFSDIFALEQGPAYRALSSQQSVLEPAKFQHYRDFLEKYYNFMLENHQWEKGLSRQSKELSTKLSQMNTEIEKITNQSYQDNVRIGDLKRELLKGQNEASLCSDRDSKLSQEKNELLKQKEKFLADIESIRQHKVDMLEPQLVASNKELRMDILQRKQQVENLQKDHDEKRESYNDLLKIKEGLDLEKEKYMISLTKASEIPPKMIKQNDVLKDAIHSLQNESVRQSDLSVHLENEIIKYTKKRGDLDKSRQDLQIEVENGLLQIEAMESHTDEIFKNHELAKEQLAIQKTERVRLESSIKKAGQDIRREHDNLLRTFREKENSAKFYLRLENMVNNIRNMIPKITFQREELSRTYSHFLNESKELKNRTKTVRQEIDLAIYTFLQQDSLETKEREALQMISQRTAKAESDLSLLNMDSLKLKQELYQASVERDMKARDLTKIKTRTRQLKEELRIKDSVIADCAKRQQEVVLRIQHFLSLYDTVKAERNKYVNMIQAANQKSSEMKEKIKILGNEVDILRNEFTAKDKDLSRDMHENATLFALRDSMRNDVNKFSLAYKEKQKEIEQRLGQIESLSRLITSNESRLKELKSVYEIAIKGRNGLALQVLERQDELCILYERWNIQQSVLKRGEMAIHMRDDEKRLSHLAIQELNRELDVLRKSKPVQKELFVECKELKKELDETKKKVLDLSLLLESPECESRGRHLIGTDAPEDSLILKIKSLEQKIADKEERLIEKELILDEMSRLTIRLSEQTKENQNDATLINQKINKLQGKLRGMNQNMMALVAELSLAQARSMQFQREKEEKEKQLEEANDRFEKGDAPLNDHDIEWQNLQIQKRRRQEQLFEQQNRRDSDDEDEGFQELPTGVRTTAILRPNAYISHDQSLPIPKPYGAFAPFKPNESGSVRYYKKPIPKPIEI